MKRVGIALILVLVIAACSLQQVELAAGIGGSTPTATRQATARPPVPEATPTVKPPSYTVKIVLDPTLTNGRDAAIVQAWTAYAEARAEWIKANVPAKTMAITGYHRSFDEEVAGRMALAKDWLAVKRKTPAVQDTYLDQLLQIYLKDFIREYTWTYYADPTWEEPPGLYLRAFQVWRQDNLKKPIHIATTLASVQVTVDK